MIVPPFTRISSRIRMKGGFVDQHEQQEALLEDTTASSPVLTRNIGRLKRRDVLLLKVPAAAAVLAGLTASTALVASSCPRPARAISLPFIPQKERRQLEVCLVDVLRITYWAEKLVLDLSSSPSSTGVTASDAITSTLSSSDNIFLSKEQVDQRQRLAYLEARLGAKAILTGKIGGGATARVYDMAALKLVDCLADIDYYYSSTMLPTVSSSSDGGGQKMKMRASQCSDLQRDFYEALATLVEFDGYDTLPDASPRSTLLLQQYNQDKLLFVRRMLTERLIPLGNQLVNSFSIESIALSRYYVEKYYPNEIISPPATAVAAS
jgi:hypothetical protein